MALSRQTILVAKSGIYSQVSPMPLMIKADIYDQRFLIKGVRRAIPATKSIYQCFGISAIFSYLEMHARHDFFPARKPKRLSRINLNNSFTENPEDCDSRVNFLDVLLRP